MWLRNQLGSLNGSDEIQEKQDCKDDVDDDAGVKIIIMMAIVIIMVIIIAVSYY